MRLLWFNLAADRNDPILAFALAWIEAVAAKVEGIDVITMRTGRLDNLPPNVRIFSVGRERGYSEARRAFIFYQTLFSLLRKHQYAGCFSHMMPLFSAMAGPILRPMRIPITTWYAHPSTTTTLKVSHFFSRHVVASIASAYPYKRDKLVVVGQGIDTERFAPGQVPAEWPPMILCAGRISPVKDHGTLLRATALLRTRLNCRFTVRILGQVIDTKYENELHALVRDLSLEDTVQFEAGVPMDKLPQWYQRCTVHVNLTPVGFGDKVAWEAMACGRPSVLANEDFAETLGIYADRLTFPHGDEQELANRLYAVMMLASSEREAIGVYLRSQVRRLHSLDSLAEKIIAVASAHNNYQLIQQASL